MASSQQRDLADVGILGAEQQHQQDEQIINLDDVIVNNDQQQDIYSDISFASASDDTTPSCRWDVHNALNNATIRGSCCAAGKADGSVTTAPHLPTAPGISIKGMGCVPFPISSGQAKELKAKARKVQNDSYHKVFQIDTQQLHKFKNPNWEVALGKLVKTVAYKLGVNPYYTTAQLDMLLYMEKGSYVDRCANADEEGGSVLGTLFVQLPSTYTGGEMKIFESEDDDVGETFDLAGGSAEFGAHFICHYEDCEYEMAKVKSGSRVILKYSLYYREGHELPTSSLLSSSMYPLEQSMKNLPRSDRLVLIPSKREYAASSIVTKGMDILSSDIRGKAEAIKSAGKKEWKLFLLNARLVRTQISHGYSYYGENENTSTSDAITISKIYDEDGNDVTTAMKWLQKEVIRFASAEEDKGMTLGNGSTVDRWGKKKSQTHSSSGGGYHHYDSDGGEEITKSTYRTTFILAFDTTSADTELKCLSGTSGVAEVTRRVVERRDYSIFERVLSVVETKENSKFDVPSCQNLLQMMIRSKKKESRSVTRINLAKKTLTGLSPSLEPSAELYDTILKAVDKFGGSNIEPNVSALLSNVTRLEGHDVTIFLRRVHFILELNKCTGNQSNLLENSIRDLTLHGASSLSYSGKCIDSIDAMISQHGWKEMEAVVKATLSYLQRARKSLEGYLSWFLLLQKALESNHCSSFVAASVAEFAKAFPPSLGSIYDGPSEQKRKAFLGAISLVVGHGTSLNCKTLGQSLIRNAEILSNLLRIIDKSGENIMLLDILNKCLLRCSAPNTYGWSKHKKDDGSIPPSIHIRTVLEKYPNIAQKTDGDGRLPLHWAVANRNCPRDSVVDIFEANPRGASVRDPVSGLFPFMLAASNDNVATSFNLLLADPSLVIRGIETKKGIEAAPGAATLAGEARKNRKRATTEPTGIRKKSKSEK